MRYAFILAHRGEFAVRTMCRVLRVAPSGFYAWVHKPVSAREKEDRRLLGLIRASHEASGGIYGSPRVLLDLREAGETCGKHRVARIMRNHKIRGAQGYKTPRAVGGGPPSLLAPNRLQRQFTVDAPDEAWVTDITYVRTWQGWLYLAVVMDLYSRRIVGWSMKPTLARSLVLDAIVMAVWRRKPAPGLIVHSDQGAQYGSDDFQRFCRAHHLNPSMSRFVRLYEFYQLYGGARRMVPRPVLDFVGGRREMPPTGAELTMGVQAPAPRFDRPDQRPTAPKHVE